MFGNDRRTALLGRIEKVRELVAGFFGAFTQDNVHHPCTVQHRTESVNERPRQRAAGLCCNFRAGIRLTLRPIGTFTRLEWDELPLEMIDACIRYYD